MAGVSMDDIHTELMDVSGGVSEIDERLQRMERLLKKVARQMDDIERAVRRLG